MRVYGYGILFEEIEPYITLEGLQALSEMDMASAEILQDYIQEAKADAEEYNTTFEAEELSKVICDRVLDYVRDDDAFPFGMADVLADACNGLIPGKFKLFDADDGLFTSAYLPKDGKYGSIFAAIPKLPWEFPVRVSVLAKGNIMDTVSKVVGIATTGSKSFVYVPAEITKVGEWEA